MRGSFLLSFFFLVAVPMPEAAGQLGTWTAHTSMRRANDLTVVGNELWVSTTGGIFRVTTDGEVASTLTAVDGLHAVGGATIEFDERRNAVWLGYSDGVLDRIDRETGAVRSFLDIARATQFTRRGINRIVVRGDSLFVCTGFGLVVFDPVRGEVRDTYSRLGIFAAATPVFDATVAPGPSGESTLWVASEVGLAYAPFNAPNLQDPSVWSTELPPTPEVRSLAYFRDRLHVGSAGDLYLRGEDGSYTAGGVSGDGIFQLKEHDGILAGYTLFKPVLVDAEGSVSQFNVEGFVFPEGVAITAGDLWVADREGGLLRLPVPPAGTVDSQPVQQQIIPEGPFHGVFMDLVAGADGSLWAGGLLGGGFYRLLPDGTWVNYTAAFFPDLAGRNSYLHVAAAPNGDGWAVSEGFGAAWVRGDGSILAFDETNSSLRAVTGFPGFVFGGGVAAEGDGGVWVSTLGAPQPLHYLSPDGEWTGLPPAVGEGLTVSATAYGRIFVDSFGQKWIIIREESSFGLVKGLLVMDTGSSPTDPADDSFRFFGTRGGGGQGLPGKSVTSVVEDRDGLVWIGTNEGLAFFVNTGVVARDPSAVAIWPQRSDRSEGTFLFLGLPVNDIAVDPANRLWIATNEGVRLIRGVEGGYEEVLQITSENSPLLSNAVIAVEVLADKGEVFFATDQGLVSVEIDAVTASATVRELFVYPNPVVVRDGATSVTIEGLVDATDLTIASPLGEQVAAMETRGGLARWDLRGRDGRLVPSGVYVVVAVGQNGEGAAYGKVAVIH